MIEAKELRIGNWVYEIPYGTSAKYPIQISTIKEHYNWDLLEPILLTPEILEKCGFERNGSFFEKDSVQIMWGYDNEKGNWFHYTVDELVQYSYFKYVHQLQNLFFALTQTELNYKP